MNQINVFDSFATILQILQSRMPFDPPNDYIFDRHFLDDLTSATTVAEAALAIPSESLAKPVIKGLRDILNDIQLCIDTASIESDDHDGPSPHLLFPAVRTDLGHQLVQWRDRMGCADGQDDSGGVRGPARRQEADDLARNYHGRLG